LHVSINLKPLGKKNQLKKASNWNAHLHVTLVGGFHESCYLLSLFSEAIGMEKPKGSFRLTMHKALSLHRISPSLKPTTPKKIATQPTARPSTEALWTFRLTHIPHPTIGEPFQLKKCPNSWMDEFDPGLWHLSNFGLYQSLEVRGNVLFWEKMRSGVSSRYNWGENASAIKLVFMRASLEWRWQQ